MLNWCPWWSATPWWVKTFAFWGICHVVYTLRRGFVQATQATEDHDGEYGE